MTGFVVVMGWAYQKSNIRYPKNTPDGLIAKLCCQERTDSWI